MTVTRAGTVGIWNGEDGSLAGEHKLGDVVTLVEPGLDGQLLIGLRSGELRLFDVAEGSARPWLQAEAGSVAFDAAGKRVALFSDLAPIRVFSTEGEDDSEPWTVDLGRTVYAGAAFDGSGRLIVLALDRDKMFRRANSAERPTSRLVVLESGKDERLEHTILQDHRARGLVLLPDGEVVLGDERGKLLRVNVETGAITAEVQLGLAGVLSLRLAADGSALWSLDAEGRLRKHDPLTLEQQSLTQLELPLPQSWRLAGEGTQHLFSRNNRAELRDATTGETVLAATGHLAPVVDLDFDPSGERLVSASFDSSSKLWDCASGALLSEMSGHGSFVYSAVHDPAGGRIATASRDGLIRIWVPGRAEAELTLRGHTAAATGLVWPTGSSGPISAGGDAQVIAWNLDEEQERWIQEVEPGVLYRAGLLGERLLISEAGCTVFESTSGRRLENTARYGSAVISIATGGSRAALGLADGWIRLLEDREGQLEASGRLGPHRGRVEALAVSPEGFIAASEDDLVRLWDAGGVELGQLGPLDSPVMSLALSPDSRMLAVGTQSGSIWLWERP